MIQIPFSYERFLNKDFIKLETRNGKSANIINEIHAPLPLIVIIKSEPYDKCFSYSKYGNFFSYKHAKEFESPTDLVMYINKSETNEPTDNIYVFYNDISMVSIQKLKRKHDNKFIDNNSHTWNYCIPFTEFDMSQLNDDTIIL